MTTAYKHKLHIHITPGDKAKFDQLFKALDPDSASKGAGLIKTSVTGEEPATRLATNTPATNEMLTEFLKIVADPIAHGLSGIPKYCHMDALKDDEVVASNIGATPKEKKWTFQKTLDKDGLQIIKENDLLSATKKKLEVER